LIDPSIQKKKKSLKAMVPFILFYFNYLLITFKHLWYVVPGIFKGKHIKASMTLVNFSLILSDEFSASYLKSCLAVKSQTICSGRKIIKQHEK
jgi:hypothetical protein